MNIILYFIECCCYYSQRLTTLQFFWWHCSTRLTARIAYCCIGWCCGDCSWQLTIGPHRLSSGPSAIDLILCHGSLVTHLWKTTLGQHCHIAGQHQLGFSVCCMPHHLLLCCGLQRVNSGKNLALESLHNVCASDTLQGPQVTVGHCPVTNKVDCREEFYCFTNQVFVLWRLGTCQEW